MTLLLAIAMQRVDAQDSSDFSGTFGNLLSPEIESLEAAHREPAGRPNVTWRIRPEYTYANGTDKSAVTLTPEFGRFAVDARALHLRPPTGAGKNEYRVRLKRQLQLPKSLARFRLAVAADYTERENSWQQADLNFSGSYFFDPQQKIAAVANLGYSRRDFDSGPGVKDPTEGLGVAWQVNTKLRLAWDYLFANDIRTKNYTVLVTTPAFNGDLSLGVGRNSTALVSYRHTLNDARRRGGARSP